MVTLSELETQARLLEHQADGLIMVSRSLRFGAKAHAEGTAVGLRRAAASLRRLQDEVIMDEAAYAGEGGALALPDWAPENYDHPTDDSTGQYL